MAGGKSTGRRRKSQAVKAAEADARQAKRNAKLLYKEHVKTMRPYLKKLRQLDLRKNISVGQRSFISKAYREFTELTTRPVKIMRFKSKAVKKAAEEFAGQTHGPKFDVVFMPAASPKSKIKIKKTKDGYHLTENYAGIDRTTVLWNIRNLAADPDREIARVLAQTSADLFIIKVGKYLYNGGLSRSLVPNAVKKLMMAYSDPTANNYYGHWLIGLETYEGNSDNIGEYRQEYKKGVERAKAEKAKERRRDKTYAARPHKRTKRTKR